MKKFLTVLLALSVVFTYSFSAVGTAFAADDDPAAKALGYVTSIHDSAKKLVSDNGDQKYNGTWEVSAANWALAYEDAYEALIDEVVDQKGQTSAIAVLNAATGLNIPEGTADREIKIALEDYLAAKADATTPGATYTAAYATDALKAQLAEEKADLIKNVEAVDTSIYSTKEYTEATAPAGYFWNKYSYENMPYLTKGDACYIAKDVADIMLNAIKDGINGEATVTDNAAASDVVTAYNDMNTWFKNYITLNGDKKDSGVVGVEDADETWTYTLSGKKNIKVLTTAEETSSEASSEAEIAAGKATIASNIAGFKASSTYLNASANDKAAYDEYLDAYKTAETYLVENVAHHTVSPVNTADTALVTNVKTAAERIEQAADFKAETNKDGSAKYDAEKIDANLAEILTELYGGAAATVQSLTDGALITYVTNVEKANEKAAIANKVNAGAKKYGNTEYYALEWKSVEAAVDAYNTAVDAAVVSSDIADAKKALKKAIDKIDTAAEVLAYYQASGKLNATAKAEYQKLNAYADSLAKDQGTADPLVFAITDITTGTMAETGADGTLVKYYIDKDARTAAEVTALNAEVKALLGSAKTKSALKTEAENVKNMINALPAKANITTADKDAIEAAYNAYEDLNPEYKVYVTNYSTLQDAISAVQKAEKDVFLAETKNLPPLAKVTVADKEAVQAVADKIDVYNDTEMYNVNPKYSNTTVDDLLDKIRTLELDAVKAAAKDVPDADKVTADDKEKIEAARAAYDEYLANYGDDLTADEVNALKGYEQDIVEAEKALKAEIEKKNDQEKLAVRGTHVKINSKAGKGYIKISWGQKDNGVKLDGYEVYRSTKKNSGFKKISTFKVQKSMKYTKNMKKGTKYYFYVKGYKMVGDEKVYADTSIKVYRTFRK